MNHLVPLIAWLPEHIWLVPISGAFVCLVAFLVGWRFLASRPTTRLDPAEVLDAGLQGINRDRRSAPRRKGNTVEVELTPSTNGQAIRGWVQDRSTGGLCLLVEQPIAAGTLVRVRPRHASITTPWTDITIRSCRQEGDQFELGCQFHHTPNWSLLLLFG